MRRQVLLSASVAATLGAAAALGAGLGAQAVDGLDLKAVRERASRDPEAAALFEQSIARRGDRFKAEAAELAAKGKAALMRPQAAPARSPSDEIFDFDAMIAEAGTAAKSEAQELPRLMAFASLSMPGPALRQMIADVSRVGGVVVFRGFPANSARRFTAALSRVLPEGSVRSNVGIDPRLFRAFDVEVVPTYVLTTTGFDLCDGFDCRTPVPPHDRIAGNTSLGYALATVGAGGGPAAAVADIYAARLGLGR